MIEKYVDGSVGAMVRGGCLPGYGNTRISWKYDEEYCVRICGEVEPEEHVQLDWNIYMDVRRRWKETGYSES